MTSFPRVRPRRLRSTPAMRALVRECRVDPAQLIAPVFVREGISEPAPISSMPGQFQFDLDSLRRYAARCAEAGLGGIDLFGVPGRRDATGSAALDPEGILNRGISAVREEVGDALVVIADTCLDEFTDHGHCGVLDEEGRIDNDATLPLYAKMALAQARAGAHMVSPSGMMDGQVGAIRDALDAEGFTDVAILAYSAKYASAFYGPFREAVASSLRGDRRSYQQDPANGVEARREVRLDIAEGADIVMVKPALGYLDVLAEVSAMVDVPTAAYVVSGEYAMVEAAAANGWIDRDRAVLEALTSVRRAGAAIICTYWAVEVANWLGERS